jgi:hypothetical protein
MALVSFNQGTKFFYRDDCFAEFLLKCHRAAPCGAPVEPKGPYHDPID